MKNARTTTYLAVFITAIFALISFAGCAATTTSKSPALKSKQTRAKKETVKTVYKHRRAEAKTVHTVQHGDNYSTIAMAYYDTYLTQVYYEPKKKKYMADQAARKYNGKKDIASLKIGNVSEVLEKVNGIPALKLRAGQQLKLPEIDGLPLKTPEL